MHCFGAAILASDDDTGTIPDRGQLSQHTSRLTLPKQRLAHNSRDEVIHLLTVIRYAERRDDEGNHLQYLETRRIDAKREYIFIAPKGVIPRQTLDIRRVVKQAVALD